MAEPKVLAVVPVLNEAHELPGLLASLRGFAIEVVVADGGSADGTREAARGAVWVDAPRGRGPQLNAGAAAAAGDVLWFLHADTRVSPEGVAAMREALRDPAVAWGAFRFSVDAEGLRYRLLERGVAARCRLLGLPYGDQAVFVRRGAFEAAGCFPEWPRLEDVELARRLLRSSGRPRLLAHPALTSARRWEREGFWRTTARNQALLLRWALGCCCRAPLPCLPGRGGINSSDST